jgi:hypothetical protein
MIRTKALPGILNLTTDLTDHTDKKKIFNHGKHEKDEREKRANTLFSCPFVFFVVIFLRGSVCVVSVVCGYPKLRLLLPLAFAFPLC